MKLGIVVGSTRPNRVSLKEAKWIAKTAKELDGVEPEIVDLKDYPMPFFDEPASPRYNPDRKIEPAVQKWLDKINQFDAYIFVTAEYNHSIPAVLKNAIDYITTELNRKPATVVSHGSVGGARATMHLKEILSESRAAIIPQAVTFIGVSDAVDEEGNLNEDIKANPYGPYGALQIALVELKWYSDALSVARSKD